MVHAKSRPALCGGGGVLYLSNSHKMAFRVGLGEDTNNIAEWKALAILLRLEEEQGITLIKVPGRLMKMKLGYPVPVSLRSIYTRHTFIPLFLL